MGKPKDPFENPDKKSVMRLGGGPRQETIADCLRLSCCHKGETVAPYLAKNT